LFVCGSKEKKKERGNSNKLLGKKKRERGKNCK
jgi:hypothetical protein